MEDALEVHDAQDLHRLIDPLPYFPKLCRVLGGVTISIVFVYLEIHHPAPEPDPAAPQTPTGRRILPFFVDCDQACADLKVSRRTLDTALMSLGVWWKKESLRSAAARSGRDFSTSSLAFPPSSLMRIRPYAIVGARAEKMPVTLAIHRNVPRINQILDNAGILPATPTDGNSAETDGTSAPSSCPQSTSEILSSALGLKPVKRGIDWGWSAERTSQHSARMTALWAERRAKGLVGGSRTRR